MGILMLILRCLAMTSITNTNCENEFRTKYKFTTILMAHVLMSLLNVVAWQYTFYEILFM